MRPSLAVIVAVAKNGVIGRAGALPWHLPGDLRHFRALTIGHSVIMGRRTWESLGRALPGRQNIVVSRRAGSAQSIASSNREPVDASREPVDASRGLAGANRELAGAIVVASLDEALAAVTMPEPAFCIGGGELYRAALRVAELAYVTEIGCDVEGDTTFPPLPESEWKEVSRDADTGGAEPEKRSAGAEAALPYRFVTYRRHKTESEPATSIAHRRPNRPTPVSEGE